MECYKCKSENVEGSVYCVKCGEPVDLRQAMLLREKIRAIIKEETKDQRLVEAEFADAAWKWGQRFLGVVGIVVSIALVVLGILGWNQYSAIRDTLKDAQETATEIQKKADTVKARWSEIELKIQAAEQLHQKVCEIAPKVTTAEETLQRIDAIDAKLEEHEAGIDFQLGLEVGRTEVPLDGKGARLGKPANIGRLITYIMTADTQCEMALLESSTIRSGLPEGVITGNDILRLLPAKTVIYTLKLEGKDLDSLLQKTGALQKGRLLAFGIDYEILPSGTKLKSVRGKPFDPSKFYKAAVSAELANGVVGYEIFKDRGKEVTNTHLVLSHQLMNFIAAKKVITGNLIDELN
jgi:hypothetical protein